MYALFLLWTGTIPVLPMLFGSGALIWAFADGLLFLSALALWVERERPETVRGTLHPRRTGRGLILAGHEATA